MEIRRCLSSGGCPREPETPDHDFMAEKDWVVAVKVASRGDSCGTREQGGRINQPEERAF